MRPEQCALIRRRLVRKRATVGTFRRGADRVPAKGVGRRIVSSRQMRSGPGPAFEGSNIELFSYNVPLLVRAAPVTEPQVWRRCE